MLLELALDEDYHVRKAISEVVESQKASSLIFEQILQDCVSSKMPEMMNLVILFYKNLQKVSKRHLNSRRCESGGARPFRPPHYLSIYVVKSTVNVMRI